MLDVHLYFVLLRPGLGRFRLADLGFSLLGVPCRDPHGWRSGLRTCHVKTHDSLLNRRSSSGGEGEGTAGKESLGDRAWQGRGGDWAIPAIPALSAHLPGHQSWGKGLRACGGPDQPTWGHVLGRAHLWTSPPSEVAGGVPIKQMRKVWLFKNYITIKGQEWVQTQVSQTAESVFLYNGFLIAEIKGLKITPCLMQETIHRENVAILFLEVLGLSISQATEIISWILDSC